MHAWEQIQITVDYIEDHLSEEIKIESLSKLALLSQFYYQRPVWKYGFASNNPISELVS